jgi:FlaG/FlaF family flagellin (archaellin)
MRKSSARKDGVSEIVGEMLLLAIVLVLLAVFSSSLGNYLPPPRDPSVTIRMSYDGSGTATLYHKGGDAIKTSGISVIIEKNSETERFTGPGPNVTFIRYDGMINPPLFDLGDSIEVTGIGSGETISLATSHALIYSGRVHAP